MINLTQNPLPPGREFKSGYLPEFRHFGEAPGATPPPTVAPPPATMMPDLTKPPEAVKLPEKGSSSAETASFYGGAGSGSGGDMSTAPDTFHGVNPQWVAAEPGMMSVLGLSTGTGVDEMGYMHDATVFDPGALVGGLAGAALGPLGSAVGGLAGRQANWNYPVDDSGLMQFQGRNANAFDVIQNPDDFSHGEVYNAGEYMDALERGRSSVANWAASKRSVVDRALANVMASNPAFARGSTPAAARPTVGTGAKAVPAPAQTPNRGSTTERGHNVSAGSKSKGSGPSGVSSSKSKK